MIKFLGTKLLKANILEKFCEIWLSGYNERIMPSSES